MSSGTEWSDHANCAAEEALPEGGTLRIRAGQGTIQVSFRLATDYEEFSDLAPHFLVQYCGI